MIGRSMIGLGSMVLQNEARHRDDIAYIQDESVLTHGELAAAARSLASALYRVGCRHQDRVGILSRNSIEYGIVFAACHISGYIATTIGFRLAVPEMVATVLDSTPTVLLFAAEFGDAVDRIRTACPSVRYFVCIGTDVPVWAEPWERFRVSGTEESLPFAGNGDDIANLVYTSGSTGKPKGCIIGQWEFMRMGQLLAGSMRAGSSDRLVLPMPMFHIGAQALMAALHWCGGSIVILTEFRPAAYLATVEQHRITKGHLAPTMIQMLLELPDLNRFDVTSLNLIMYSASAMPISVLRRAIAAFGPIFQNSYGMTEGGGTFLDTTEHRPDGDESAQRRLRSVGIPQPGSQLAIMDEEDRPLTAGQSGEICLRGDVMFRGYWNNSAATIKAMRNGWYHSGDVGMIDEDGYVYILDRKNDMIITGGENVYSREVEDALLSHPSVAEVAALGVPDPLWGEAVLAVVVTKSETTPTAAALIEHCRSPIASYKKPRHIVFVEDLPKSATGKVNKLALRVTYKDQILFQE